MITANARSVAALPVSSGAVGPPRLFTLGTVINEYPHIPSHHSVRFARDRVESVDLRLPACFRIGYIRGTEDLRSAFVQLRLSVQSLDLALLPVADLSALTAIIVGAGVLRGESALLAAPALRAFMQRGGTVLVLPGGRELTQSGLFPSMGLQAVALAVRKCAVLQRVTEAVRQQQSESSGTGKFQAAATRSINGSAGLSRLLLRPAFS